MRADLTHDPTFFHKVKFYIGRWSAFTKPLERIINIRLTKTACDCEIPLFIKNDFASTAVILKDFSDIMSV